MNFYNDDSRKISKPQKILIIISFIIIIIWGIYFVIHVIDTIENNSPVSNSVLLFFIIFIDNVYKYLANVSI